MRACIQDKLYFFFFSKKNKYIYRNRKKTTNASFLPITTVKHRMLLTERYKMSKIRF